MQKVLDKNTGYKILDEMKTMHVSDCFQSSFNLTQDEIRNFEYAPITSTDVERSFSLLKKILTDKRTNFNFDTLKMIMVSTQLFRKN